MSPEQVQGKTVDARTDIFSFGAVLYEMICGRKLFTGESPADVMAEVLTAKAQASQLKDPRLRSIERVLNRCLVIDRDERWQTARDLAESLRWAALRETSAPSPETHRRLAKILLPCFTGAAVLALGLAFYVVSKTPVPSALVRYSIPLPPHTSYADYTTPMLSYPVVSPDGEKIAITLTSSDQSRVVWLYQMETGGFRPLRGTDGAFDITWSPDSRAIVYWASGKHSRIELSSGAITTLLVEPLNSRPAVAPNGNILVSTKAGLEWVENGRRRIVRRRDTNELYDYSPVLLPDLKHFLFLRQNLGPDVIWRGDLAGSSPVQMFPTSSQVEYASTSHIFYVNDGVLVAQRFDVQDLVPNGPLHPITSGPAQLVGPFTGFSVSPNVVAIRPRVTNNRRLVWRDRYGIEMGAVGDPGEYFNPSLSPDDKRVAVGLRDKPNGTRDIWVFDIVRGTRSRLTLDPADDLNPTWSPDGSRIAFTSNRKGIRDLYVTSSTGGQDESVLESQQHKSLVDWSSDGKYLLYDQIGSEVIIDSQSHPSNKSSGHIYILPVAVTDRKPIVFVSAPSFRDIGGRMSPDSRWVSYCSNETGNLEVYVREFSTNPAKVQVSAGGGEESHWRRDGKELIYVNGNSVMAVAVFRQGGKLELGVPKKLFDAPLTRIRSRNRVTVSKDGQKFLTVEDVPEDPRPPFTVILNWQRLLEKRL
jgi:Tol biopolymer transport system component